MFKRDELKLLSNMLHEDDWGRLQLPILIALDPKIGRGAARIRGGVEVKIVCRMLGKEGAEDELVIYRPEIAVLRNKLPSTTQYLFMW